MAGGYGLVTCGCGDWPVAAGVVVSNVGEREKIASAIRAGKNARARSLLLEKYAAKTRIVEMLGGRLTFERFMRHGLLSRLMAWPAGRWAVERAMPGFVGRKVAQAAQFNVYVRHRFTSPSLLATLPLLAMLEGRDGYVLDAPCGFGHLSYCLSKVVDERRIVGMDLFPAFAFATRRFFVPRAAAVVAHDLDHPLPAADGTFAAVFCSDAFHYIANKAGAAAEFMRLLHDDGFVAIPHLHNRLGENLYPGTPFSPAEYAGLFKGHEVRVFPERYFLETYLRDEALDLTREFPRADVDHANALTVVVAKSKDVFRRYPTIRGRLIDAAANPRVNPLYHVSRRDGGDVVFERRIPEAFDKEYREYPELARTLPERAVRKRDDAADPGPLLRGHVLIDVPAGYA